MDREQIRSMLEEIETTFPVIQWKINNIHIWPILRSIIVFSKYMGEHPPKVRTYSKKKPDRDVNLEWLNNKVDAVLLTNPGANVSIGGTQYDRFCDPIIQGLNRKKIKTLKIHSHQVKNAYESNFIESEDFYRYLNYYSAVRYIKKSEDNILLLPELFAYLHKKYNIKGLNLQSLRMMMNQIRYKANFFKMVLSRLSAKIGFVVNYYREDGYAFCLACNELGIPSVDIQHGVQGDFHFAYGGWTAIPKSGFETVPTAFWCWSEYEKQIIEGWGGQSHRAFIGGNPWLEIWKNKNSKWVTKYENILENERRSEGINILLTLQPLYGLPGWEENIPKWVLDAIKSSPDNWRWYIRMHPQMIEGGYVFESESTIEQIKAQNLLDKVEFNLATELPLPLLLRYMDVHATAHSSCIIEAQHFRVPSIVLHKNGVLGYPSQIASGSTVVALNKEQLLKKIKKQFSQKQNVKEFPLVDKNIIHTYTKILESNISHFKKIQDPLSIQLAYIDVLFIENKYEEIISEFRSSEHVVIKRYVAKSFELLGNLSEAIKYNQMYIESLSSERQDEASEAYFHIYELISIAKLFEQVNIDKEEVNKNILNFLQKIEDISNILRMLFYQGDYHLLTKLAINYKKLDHLDVLFYMGRAFKCLNSWHEAIKSFIKFIKKYEISNDVSNFSTFQQNYLLSAYFHLGECYMKLTGKEKLALECFQKCSEISETEHNKAKEYIALLENKISY